MRRSSPSTRHCASSEIGTRAIPSTQSSPIPRQPSAGSSMTTLVRDRLRPSRSSALQRLSQTRPTALPSARHRPTQAWRETNRPATWRREQPMRGRRCLGQRWIQATDGWPGIYRWPGYGGPSIDPRMARLPFLNIHGCPGPSIDPAICRHPRMARAIHGFCRSLLA